MALCHWMACARLMGEISRKRSRQSAETDPPEPCAPEGFLFPWRQFELNLSGESRNGRPGSRGSRPLARARSAGPVGGNEALGRIPRTGRTLKGSQERRVSAAQNQIQLPRKRQALVVKIPDTSHLGKAGSTPAFDLSCRGIGPARTSVSRVRAFRKEDFALRSLKAVIACSPASFSIAMRGISRTWQAVVKMSVTSVEHRASGGCWFDSSRS
jgi:hypothetical protein